MNFKNLFMPFTARKLTESDIPDILVLYLENPEYFRHCPPSPSREMVKDDMHALPSEKGNEDKYLIGFFDGDTLVAVMDLIARYPDDQTAFIGLLMLSKKRQGKGIGTFLVRTLSEALKATGYMRIRLGYVKTNLSAQKFWLSQGFRATGAESVREHYTVIEAEKTL